MSLFLIPFPIVDPVAFSIGPVDVRWYGLSYMFGLLFAWLYVKYLLRNKALWRGKPPAGPEIADDILLWSTLGVVIGGRLGNVLFYNPVYFFNHPLEIVQLWRGGMSFHGGLLGVVLANYLYGRAKNLPFLSLGDLGCAAAPLGLFFGRLANFVNQELVGRPADVPWAMIFPDVDNVPRHPSQLYEACFEGLLLFAACRYFTHRRQALTRPGFVSGVFFAGYGIARITGEVFRQYDPEHILSTGILTPGMVYSVPMVLFGAWMMWRSSRKHAAPA